MRPIVWMKSSTGIPLSAWTFLKTCSARSGFSCGACWARAHPAPISATTVISTNFRIQTSFYYWLRAIALALFTAAACRPCASRAPLILLMAARYRACIVYGCGLPALRFARSAHFSEEVFQRKLHDSRVTGRENLSKVPAVQSENGIVRIQMVRHVERFGPELYGLPLRHSEFSG